MTNVVEMLQFNEKFVAEPQKSGKYPRKKLVIVTCMDTRLVELLPNALNIRDGDAKIIKVAGAVVSHPYGAVMRSIVVALYALGAEEIWVIGHDDCGMIGLDREKLTLEMEKRGVKQVEKGYLNKWLVGFDKVEDSVQASVTLIQSHPLVSSDTQVYGMVIHPHTGKVRLVSSK